MCPHCKSSIEGYQPVTGSSALVDSESTICTVSFRDYSDQVISLPSAFKISKSINSGKIYDQLNMLLFTGKFCSFGTDNDFQCAMLLSSSFIIQTSLETVAVAAAGSPLVQDVLSRKTLISS